MHTYKKICLLCVILFWGFFVAKAQNVGFEKENFPNRAAEFEQIMQDLDTGVVLFNNGIAYCKYNLEYQYCQKGYKFYKEAIPYLLQAQKFNPNNAELNFQLGISYFYSPFKYKALEYFSKSYMQNKSLYVLIDYYLGCSYHLDMQWDKAIEHYSAALEVLKIHKDIKHFTVSQIEHYIEQCKNGKLAYSQDSIKVRISNIGTKINTSYPEYGAITIGDGRMMLFTSRRDSLNDENASGEADVDENLKNPESIYLSYKSNEKWLQARKIHYPINKDNEHDAILSVAPDGKSILIYKRGDIFESLFLNGKWTDPDAIEGDLNTSSSETSAIYSPDMKTIFFTSDRPESLGGKDIFIGTINANGVCTKITNLGSNVNTPYDEDGLYLTDSGDELYFSSEGHNSIGGYDVFVTHRIDSVNWSKPVNVGIPINTPGDDIFFVLNTDKKHGFYTSYRADGYGEKDLYTFEFDSPYNVFSTIPAVSTVKSELVVDAPVVKKVDTVSLYSKLTPLVIHGTVYDFDTKKTVDANIKVVEKNAKDTIREFLTSNGNYSISLYDSSFYKFVVVAQGYTTKEEIIKTPTGVKSFDISHFLVKESSFICRIDTIADIFVESIGKDKSLIEGRIFDFLSDDNVIANIKIVDAKTDSVVEVTRSDAKTGKFKVAVPSGKEYKIIADANGYLFQSNRISTWAAKPYVVFEDKMFKNNEAILRANLDSIFSTVKYVGIANVKGLLIDSAQNKPVAAKIKIIQEITNELVASTESDAEGRYTMEIPTGSPYWIEIAAEGYVPLRKRLEIPVSAKIIELLAQMRQIPVAEKSIKFSDIQYETGQYVLTPTQRLKLSTIQEILTGASSAHIIIVGYTDDKGTSVLNLELSKNRASEVARYIQQYSNNKQVKIEIDAKGELDPIVPNSTDEGRARNRRTEIIVRQLN